MNPHQTLQRKKVDALKGDLEALLFVQGYRAFTNGRELTVYARTRVPEREEDIFVDDGGTRVGRDRVLKVSVRKADADNAVLHAQVVALLHHYGIDAPQSYAGTPGTQVYDIRRKPERLITRIFGLV